MSETLSPNEVKAKAFLAKNPDILQWFDENRPRWDGADNIWHKLHQFGQLTPNQETMIRNQIAGKRKPQGKSSNLDLTPLAGFCYGVPFTSVEDNRLKVKVNKVDRPGTRWHGFIFVNDAAEYGKGKRYGMQGPGEKYRGDIIPELTLILNNRLEAMAKYGKLTNKCSNCGRKLEDAESVRIGIGPVCRKNLGYVEPERQGALDV